MKEIPLTNWPIPALIDDEDYELVTQFKWTRHKNGHASGWKGKKIKGVKMHRLIMGFPQGLKVDHKDHNKLNNQKYNLRNATSAQNNANKSKQPSSSRFKGVSWSEERQKWAAGITCNYKRIGLGRFEDEVAAAMAYNEAAKRLFGEFACLNVIESNGLVSCEGMPEDAEGFSNTIP